MPLKRRARRLRAAWLRGTCRGGHSASVQRPERPALRAASVLPVNRR